MCFLNLSTAGCKVRDACPNECGDSDVGHVSRREFSLAGDVAGSTFRNADTKLPDHLDKTLKAVHDMPKDKYPYPQTEQQVFLALLWHGMV